MNQDGNSQIVPSSNGGPERDESGKFVAGNRGGPGGPAARHARQIRERLDTGLDRTSTQERVNQLLEKLWEISLAGDVGGIKILLGLLEGNPLRRVIERMEAIVAVKLGVDPDE